jgi:hypothetical protein
MKKKIILIYFLLKNIFQKYHTSRYQTHIKTVFVYAAAVAF